MDEFCGSDFWNETLTWDTPSEPDFTHCFESTVLVWVPCVFLWGATPFEAYALVRSRNRDIPWSSFNVTKLIISSIMLLLQISVLIRVIAFRPAGEDMFPVNYVSPCILLFTILLQMIVLVLEKRRGLQSSAYLFMFWLLMAVCGLPTLRSHFIAFEHGTETPSSAIFITDLIQHAFVLTMFALNFFSDKRPRRLAHPKGEKPWPEEEASFPSRLTFSWFTSLVWRGFKDPLTQEDLWHLPYSLSSSKITQDFEKHWSASRESTRTRPFSYDRLGVDGDPLARGRRAMSVSILPVLFRAFGWQFLFASLVQLVSDLLKFTSPVLTSLLIAFTEDHTQPQWRGYLYAFLFLALTQCNSLLRGIYFDALFNIAIKIRTAIISAIYLKALKLSNSAKKRASVGEVINLMAIDAQQFMYLTPYVNMVWSAPLQITISLYYLWKILGPSAFAGVALLAALIPLNGYVASRQRTLQDRQMAEKDRRVKMMSEILNGIRGLKLYAWEPCFEARATEVRNEEMKKLTKMAQLDAITGFIWTCSPFLVSLATFGVFVSVSPEPLDSQKAFVSITLLNMLRMPFTMLPSMIATTIQVGVSLKRINKYLSEDELDCDVITDETDEDFAVLIKDGSFRWGPDGGEDGEAAPVLRQIDLRVRRGTLVGVVGVVGAGKSALCSAILGEMEKVAGRANVDGSIAYVPQQAWLRNASLENNILFGRRRDDHKYEDVIAACALHQDFDALPAGDQTEIGEKGMNLSGGQKQRVSLARAVYFDAQIYILDDPLSAVDAHVGKHLFDHVIGPQGLLKQKTRLLVTHSVGYLRQMDHIVVLKDGAISQQGTYAELMATEGGFQEILLQYSPESQESEGTEEVGKERPSGSILAPSGGSNHDDRSRERCSENRTERQKAGDVGPRKGQQLVEEETAETGRVSCSVYWRYVQAIGVGATLIVCLLSVTSQGLAIGSNLWLSRWSEDSNATQVDVRNRYLGVYATFGFFQGLATFVEELVGRTRMLAASGLIYRRLLWNVMRQPVRFFDTTPVGRVLSRFSKDTDAIDVNLPMDISDLIFCLTEVAATLVVIVYATPIVLVVLVPISVGYYFVQTLYVTTSRQLRRIESVSRSPIYSHFGETIQGATSIRAYHKQESFILEAQQKVDLNVMSYYPTIKANRWLSIRLEFVSNVVTFAAAIFAVSARTQITGGVVGLSISYALSVTLELNYLIRMVSEVETNAVAIERVMEYSQTPQEAPWIVENNKPSPDWPQEGHIFFDGYATRYREGLDLAIRGITCEFHPGEKVGVVGRTGAGKSSLTMALFRILEGAAGRILIDGLDIALLGLHDLRGRITIIPQDPVLFSGTLRMNLDPYDDHSDEAVWNALELSHLHPFVSSLTQGLHHHITDGGENLSVGQRQLVCLTRALLRKTKILVLDEATAAVDLETDDVIQATIRREFASCTVITIAHRLNTIMDYTRVMVMDRGMIREFESPDNLLRNPDSFFYKMAKDAGLV